MRRRSWNYVTSLARNKFSVILLILANAASIPVVASESFEAKDIPLGRDFLRLPKGRWIWLAKTGQESTRAMIGRGKKSDRHAIWFRDFKGEEYDHAWNYAYFVHLKPGRLLIDLDGDGSPEVGIATYDYGNSVIRNVMIFTIKNNELQFLRQQGPFNLETDLSLYK